MSKPKKNIAVFYNRFSVPIDWDRHQKGLRADIRGLTHSFCRLEYLEIPALEQPLDQALQIARAIQEKYKTGDGFVVIEGRDPASTAGLLSSLFENLSKPVVVVTAPSVLGDKRNNFVQNLEKAISVAATSPKIATPEVKLVDDKGVLHQGWARQPESNSYQGPLRLTETPDPLQMTCFSAYEIT